MSTLPGYTIQPGDEFSESDVPSKRREHWSQPASRRLSTGHRSALVVTPKGLLRVSEATGLHVVAATGVHRDAHYLADDALRATTAEALADRFVADITGEGSAQEWSRRVPATTACRSSNRRYSRRRRGPPSDRCAPLCPHRARNDGTWHRRAPESPGCPRNIVLLAHLRPQPRPRSEHAETGATASLGSNWTVPAAPSTAGLDRSFGSSPISPEHGLAGQLLLGRDTGRSSMMRAYGGGPGLDYLFARFKPPPRRELGEELSRTIFVENPARAFAFEPLHGASSFRGREPARARPRDRRDTPRARAATSARTWTARAPARSASVVRQPSGSRRPSSATTCSCSSQQSHHPGALSPLRIRSGVVSAKTWGMLWLMSTTLKRSR